MEKQTISFVSSVEFIACLEGNELRRRIDSCPATASRQIGERGATFSGVALSVGRDVERIGIDSPVWSKRFLLSQI